MSHDLSEPVRKEIFSALVEVQDQEMPVAESHREIPAASALAMRCFAQ